MCTGRENTDVQPSVRARPSPRTTAPQPARARPRIIPRLHCRASWRKDTRIVLVFHLFPQPSFPLKEHCWFTTCRCLKTPGDLSRHPPHPPCPPCETHLPSPASALGSHDLMPPICWDSWHQHGKLPVRAPGPQPSRGGAQQARSCPGSQPCFSGGSLAPMLQPGWFIQHTACEFGTGCTPL